MPERALRGYLAAGFPLIVPAGRKRAWLRVAPIDAARVAVFAKLVQWGLTVRESASIVREFFDCLLIDAGADPAAVEWSALIHCAAGVSLSISRDGTGRLALPRGRPAVEQPILTIDVAACIRDAHRRADEPAAQKTARRASSAACRQARTRAPARSGLPGLPPAGRRARTLSQPQKARVADGATP